MSARGLSAALTRGAELRAARASSTEALELACLRETLRGIVDVCDGLQRGQDATAKLSEIRLRAARAVSLPVRS